MSSTYENVTDHYVTINGLNIHYRDWGDPQLPRLVVLHGLEAHSYSWDHVAAALADRYRVIVPDLRGHGESSWAPEYNWQLILEDTIGLMNALDISETILCGHSVGGRVSYMLASQHPERVIRLVIIEADPMILNLRKIEMEIRSQTSRPLQCLKMLLPKHMNDNRTPTKILSAMRSSIA